MAGLDDRKRQVLRAIVDDYIHTAEPVGSRTVARKYNLGVSPATIRNEMADLEFMGYLEQPHTSAGRIPSDKGYRFYVDTLVGSQADPDLDQEGVRQVLAFKAQRMEGVVRQAAHLLGEATEFLGVASQPAGTEESIVALQVVPLRGPEAVIVLVADTGSVRTKMIQFPHTPSARDVEAIGQALSQRLRGMRLGELGSSGREIARELGQFGVVLDQVLQLLGERSSGGERLLVDGTTNLLQQPEFQDVAKAKRVLHALEREELLAEMLGDVPRGGQGLEVAIGREMQLEEMADCSLVTAVYAAPGGVLGRVGVLGPRRMDYRRVMRLVEGVAQAVTNALGAEAQAPQLTRLEDTELRAEPSAIPGRRGRRRGGEPRQNRERPAGS